MDAPTWLLLTSFLAVIATAYGVVTRAWPLAAFGQIFLAVSIWEFFTQIWTDQPVWYFPLAPITVLGMLSFAAAGWLNRHSTVPNAVRQPVLKVALVYRWAALALSLCWLWQYVPAREHVWVFMSVAAGMFALAGWKRNREALIAAAVYAAISLGALWFTEDFKMDIAWPNLAAVLALLAMQQILRRKLLALPYEDHVHASIIFIAGVSLWRFISCWAATLNGEFFMTMTWAGFAVLIFATGILLRERFHRWFGLAVLAGSVARVITVDVWNEGTIYRVLTFMALGVTLLVIGFIYNKYQEKIRQWL